MVASDDWRECSVDYLGELCGIGLVVTRMLLWMVVVLHTKTVTM